MVLVSPRPTWMSLLFMLILFSERTRPSVAFHVSHGVAACPRQEGDDVCLVGASPALGNWDPSRALQLNTGRAFQASASVPAAAAGCRSRQLTVLQVPASGRTGPRRLLWPRAQSAS